MKELTMNEVEEVNGGMAIAVGWFVLGIVASEIIREVRAMPRAVRTGLGAARARGR
jgi:hypothetical protein